MNAEIEAQDVIRLMLQYMKENNLRSSMSALQIESGVSMNTVDNVEAFINDIKQGKWETVLIQIGSLQLQQDKLIAVRNNDAVNVLLIDCIPLQFFIIIVYGMYMIIYKYKYSYMNKLYWN